MSTSSAVAARARRSRARQPSPTVRLDRPTVFLILACVALGLSVFALVLLPFSDMNQVAHSLSAFAGGVVGSSASSAVRAAPQSTPGPGRATPAPTGIPGVVPAATPMPTPNPACPPPAGWEPYVVRAGDTVSQLAYDHNTTSQALIDANCLTGAVIHVAQVIYLPGSNAPAVNVTPTATAASTASAASATPTPAGLFPSPTPPRVPLPAGAAQKLNVPPGVINIVLLGSDTRAQGGLGRTDTMILVSINPAAKTVTMLSIPRDLWVYIPSYGYDRINTANVWGTLMKYPGGGLALVKATIEYNFGVPVHYYAMIDFKGFIKLIDTLGGVTIAVDCPYPDLELEPGIRHMNGQWALAYARSRITSSDFARSRRQQQVLRALWDQVLRPETIAQIPTLWTTFQDSIATDMTPDQVISLAYLGTQINTRQIRSLYIDYRHVKAWVTPEGAQVELPIPDQIRTVFAELLAPTGELDLIQAKVEIRNAGCTRFQATELAAVRLHYIGFARVQIGPDQPETRPRTIIIDYTGDKEAIAYLQEAFNVPDQDVWRQQQDNPPLDAIVLLGRNFNPCSP